MVLSIQRQLNKCFHNKLKIDFNLNEPNLRTKTLISKALIGVNNPFYNKTQSLETKIRIIEAKMAYPFYVYKSYRV